TSFRCHAVCEINCMHAVDADEEHVASVAIATIVVRARGKTRRERQSRQEHARKQSNAKLLIHSFPLFVEVGSKHTKPGDRASTVCPGRLAWCDSEMK